MKKRDFSLRRPTASQERGGRKRSRPAPFEMTRVRREIEWGALKGAPTKTARARELRGRFVYGMGKGGI